MARPIKNTAEYFSHDKDMRNDVKIKAVRRKYGHTGFSTWIFLLETIIDSENFIIEYNEINRELLAADFEVDVLVLDEILSYLSKLNLIQMENNLITCHNLVKRLEGLLSKRNRDRQRYSKHNENINQELPTAETDNKTVSDGDNPTVNKSKVNKSKGKDNKEEVINTAAKFENFTEAENKVTEPPPLQNTKIESVDYSYQPNNPEPVKKPDFIDQLINIFSDEYLAAKNIDYVITAHGKERSNMQKILAAYKKQNPQADTAKTLTDLQDFFQKCLNIPDNWLNENCTIPFVNSQFAKYNAQIFGKKTVQTKSTSKNERKEQFIQDWNKGKIQKEIINNINGEGYAKQADKKVYLQAGNG